MNQPKASARALKLPIRTPAPPCAAEPDLFTSESADGAEQLRAKRLCRSCAWWWECRRAGRAGLEIGIWGGETRAERLHWHRTRTRA